MGRDYTRLPERFSFFASPKPELGNAGEAHALIDDKQVILDIPSQYVTMIHNAYDVTTISIPLSIWRDIKDISWQETMMLLEIAIESHDKGELDAG